MRVYSIKGLNSFLARRLQVEASQIERQKRASQDNDCGPCNRHNTKTVYSLGEEKLIRSLQASCMNLAMLGQGQASVPSTLQDTTRRELPI